jgi:hypothetical protein
MERSSVAVFLFAVAGIMAPSTTSAGTIQSTASAGPGVSLSASITLTFYVDSPGPVTFAPSNGFGSTLGCIAEGAGAWGCLYDVDDRIVLETGSITDRAVIQGFAGLGTLPSSNNIESSTQCTGLVRFGFYTCTDNFAPGAYSVLLSVNESIHTGRLINSVPFPGTASVSVTISGPTVLASPEPATMGTLALALGIISSLFRHRVVMRT